MDLIMLFITTIQVQIFIQQVVDQRTTEDGA